MSSSPPPPPPPLLPQLAPRVPLCNQRRPASRSPPPTPPRVPRRMKKSTRRPHRWLASVIRRTEGCAPSFLLLLVVLSSCPSTASCQGWDGVFIGQVDYQGLQAFKHALDDPRGVLRSWNDTGLDACSGAWVGIKCVNGKVIAIQLPWRGLGGRITEKIGQLTALRKLSLHDNSIGGQIPPSVGFLAELRGVHLFNNRFSGTIPPSIGNCIALQSIDLSNNLLVGNIPYSIANSTKLYRLNLSYNNLSGRIPATITQSFSLTCLLLHRNNLSGSIPDTWGVWKGTSNSSRTYQLQILSLDYNSLTGDIPRSLGRLQEIRELTLSSNRLTGGVPEEFGNLSFLQKLDLSGNSLRGSIPSSLCNLSSLAQLSLEGNHIDGEIPEAIDGLRNLSLLSLKGNQLAGEIPATVGNISSLKLLDLSENNLTGAIPIFLTQLIGLIFLNVSSNNLSGQVPLLLSEKFNSSSFRGNLLLCGYSISEPCPSSSPPPTNLSPFIAKERHGAKLSSKDIALLVSGVVLAVLLLFCCLFLCSLIRKRVLSKQRKDGTAAERAKKPDTSARTEAAEPGGGGEEAGGRLVHFDGPLAFTADDLLCATAEIMAKSTYGTVYKATLEDGNHVAVKRLREKITKSQKEFETEVGELGKARHQNLLELRAYYLGPKGEKLLVFDYMPKGSLATFLHARGPDAQIDWETRMNIAKGIARGLGYIHNDLKTIHGNLTSSNILLDGNRNPKIADYGLLRLVTAAASSTAMASAGVLGYRAPELSKLKKANTKTDVYSLGVVILELLTGKAPGDMANGMDLPQWVASSVREEWTNEVFDLELMRNASGTAGDEMLNTLKLALHCVDPSSAARPEAMQVLQQLDEIRPDGVAGCSEEGDSAGSTAAASASND